MVVLGLAILSFFGLAVVLNLTEAQRAIFLPATPIVGAAVLIVVLHLTGLVFSARVGMLIAVVAALAAIVVGFARQRTMRVVSPSAFVAAAIILAVGSVGAVLALLPSMLAGSALTIQPSASNDAFYYVSVSNWMLANPLTDVPRIGASPLTGSDSPAFGPTVESLNLGLRVGQEMLHAGISSLLGQAPSATLSPLLGLYVLILPGGAWVLGAAFRMPTAGRLMLGGVLVTSFSLINQVANQNADSILGIAFIPLVLGTCGLALFRAAGERVTAPLWVAAVALSALVGTYSELIPFLFASLGTMALVGPLAALKTRVLRAVAILVIAIVVGPVIWFRALQGLLLVGSISTQQSGTSPSVTSLLLALAGPYQVLLTTGAGRATLAGVAVLFAAISAGVVLALLRTTTRGIAIGAFVATAGALYIGLRGNWYITGRAIDMVTPFVLIAAVLGWSNVARGVNALANRRLALAVTSIVVALGVGGMAVGARVASTSIVAGAADDRVVTEEFAEAAEWIREVDDPSGDDVAVAVGTMYDQLWISDALAEMPDVSYVSLRGDLGYRSNLSMVDFWDKEENRYVLVGPGAFAEYETGALVASNSRFRLIDMSAGATVAIPVAQDGNWLWTVDEKGAIDSQGNARVQILSSASTLDRISLAFAKLPAGRTLEASDGGATPLAVTGSGATATVHLEGVEVMSGVVAIDVRTVPEGSFALTALSGE